MKVLVVFVLKIYPEKDSKFKITETNFIGAQHPLQIEEPKCEEGYFYYCEPIIGNFLHRNMPKRNCYCKKKEGKN